MIHAELIKNRFDSLEDYEKFAAEWTEVCCMVNQNSRNMGNRERFKKIRNWNGCRYLKRIIWRHQLCKGLIYITKL